jgi:DNA-binding MarR family transcriptional regulator
MNEVHNVGRTTPGDVLARLFELSIVLADAMGNGLVERGLTRARATVVWQLYHQGPCTQRELSQALGVTPRNVTGLLDALETDGFVARGPHPTDRRATVVTLTDRGRRTSATLHAEQQECARMLFEDVPPDELGVFLAVLDQVVERLRTADFEKIRLAALQRLDEDGDG